MNKTKKYNEYVTYKGAVEKKQPCGQGTMTINLPNIYNADVLSGVFENLSVSEGKIAFANSDYKVGKGPFVEKVVFVGRFNVDIQPSRIKYHLLDGVIKDGETSFRIEKEYVVTRDYLATTTLYLKGNSSFSWRVRHDGLAADPYVYLFNYANKASFVDISGEGSYKVDTFTGNISYSYNPLFTLRFNNGCSGTMNTGGLSPLKWDKHAYGNGQSLYIEFSYEWTPQLECTVVNNNEEYHITHLNGGSEYSDILEYKRVERDFVMTKKQFRSHYKKEDPYEYLKNELSEYIHADLMRSLDEYLENSKNNASERLYEYGGNHNYNPADVDVIVKIDYTDGSSFVGQLKKESGIISADQYMVGVYTATDGQQEIYYNGVSLTEIKSDFFERKQMAQEERLARERASEEAAEQERLRKEQQYKAYYEKYGREYVDYWINESRKVKVGMPEEMILDFVNNTIKDNAFGGYKKYNIYITYESQYTISYELSESDYPGIKYYFDVDKKTKRVCRVYSY